MYIRNVRKRFLIIGVLVLMVSGFFNCGMVSAQNHIENSDTSIFIDSRFKLWDVNEKMLDAKFNITIFYFNESTNNSAYYKIDIDNTIIEGNFTYFITNQFNINTTLIHYIRIYINNVSVFYETNIVITNQVSKSLIDYGNSQWTINLSPFQWTQKERNIFFSGIICFFVSLPMVYLIIKNFKKGRGHKTYK